MKKYLSILFIILCVSSFSVLAQNQEPEHFELQKAQIAQLESIVDVNYSFVEQEGMNNNVLVEQLGTNLSYLKQEGESMNASVYQEGDHNVSYAVTIGKEITYSVYQKGTENTVAYYVNDVSDYEKSVSTAQVGDYNEILLKSCNEAAVIVAQYGNENYAAVDLSDASLSTDPITITQNGGAAVTVSQSYFYFPYGKD